MTSDTVRAAAALPDINHRESAFGELFRDTKRRLLHVYPATVAGWHPYLIGGSGTAAVEAMITSLLPDRGKTLILENGYYSSRIREIFEVYGLAHETLSFGWLDAWDFELIEKALVSGEFYAVLGTHNETTTGRLNDIGSLGKLAREHGVKTYIDAMSSFGADAIPFENLDAVCSSANKCLHGLPGVAFVLVSEDLAEECKSFPRRNYYLNLPMYAGDSPPLTPPVSALSAFRQALVELGDKGATGRGEDYNRKISYLRHEMRRRGFVTATPDFETSCTLSSFNLPDRWTFDEWSAANHEHGFVIYGCKGELREQFFQVSVMGEVTHRELEDWIKLVEWLL